MAGEADRQRVTMTEPGISEGASPRLAARLSSVGLDYGRTRALDGIDLEIPRSEEHTSELQSLMRISYAVFCLNKKNNTFVTFGSSIAQTRVIRIQSVTIF